MGVEKEEEVTRGGIRAVEPRPRKGVSSRIVDWLERAVVYLTYDKSKPQHYLAGNFAPVADETPPCTDLIVRGSLPV
ncbi:Carotenoid 9,10(9',10')-cleavage dioxygenase [Acorus calamus]|uniref:Carotenoid 9,10(9',10')-cleavage dioxygenase n=1 Tax=Acorus calamus TaxID=4465 RepID=A0AAV9BYR1_ACOCL|nr:Carotenoid 9,10(9',10')-cleavage dioxygenase [Acorus calamus]